MDLVGRVVVITGASSGIGRASAHEVARRGANVVLLARNHEALGETARECEQWGVRALPIACDVTDEQAVGDAAKQALDRFGHVDGWVNAAAVTAFGEFDQVPSEVFRRVIETNLFGTVHGCRAAVACLRSQGRGVIVNVSSVAGKIGQPYATAYSTSKFAIRGFSEALRKELYGTGVDVCVVLPESTDTPLFQHGANYSRREVQPMPPVDSAAKVARVIADVLEKPKREATIGPSGRLAVLLKLFGGRLGERYFKRLVERKHFKDTAAPVSAGNLYRPEHDEESGGWRSPTSGRLAGPARLAGMTILPLVAWRWARPRLASTVRR